MRRPRRLILATISGLLVFGYFLLWLTSPGPGMNRRGFDLVRVGMNEAEVMAILGAEPSDYITASGWKEWWCNEGIVHIRFDAAGRVQDKGFQEFVPATQPFLVKLRRWFLLQA